MIFKNIKTIALGDLWSYCGVRTVIGEEVMIFVEREMEDSSLHFMKDGTSFYLDGYEDDTEIIIDVTSAEDRCTNLIQSYGIVVIGLIEDGWSLDDDDYNLKPYYTKLEELTKLKGILEDDSMDDDCG